MFSFISATFYLFNICYAGEMLRWRRVIVYYSRNVLAMAQGHVERWLYVQQCTFRDEDNRRKEMVARRWRSRRRQRRTNLWIGEWAMYKWNKIFKTILFFLFFTNAICSCNLPKMKESECVSEVEKKTAKHNVYDCASLIHIYNSIHSQFGGGFSVCVHCKILVNGRDNSYGCTLCTWRQ